MATEATTQAVATEPVKITFTPEQQARVDEIVRESMGRAAREVRTDLDRANSDVARLNSELEAAKTAARAATTPGEKKAANEDVEALKNQISEMKSIQTNTQAELDRTRKLILDKEAEVTKAKSESLDVKKQVAIQRAAEKSGFVKADLVAKLTSDSIKYDDQRNRFVVLNDQGTERLNNAYEPMSLEEFYAEYAVQNPFLVRGDAKGGAGSSQSQQASIGNARYDVKDVFGKTSNAAVANKLAKENIQEYRRLRSQAQSLGLIG